MFRTILTGLFARSPRVAARKAMTCRLALEQLGDRVVPAIVILTVNTTADTSAVNPNVSPADPGGSFSLRSDIEYANKHPMNDKFGRPLPWATNHYEIDLSQIGGQTITLGSTLVLNTNFDFISANGSVTLTPPTGANAPKFNHFNVNPGTESHFMNLELAHGSCGIDGGSIWNGGTAYFSNCTFVNNTAAGSGGAIATDENATTTVQDCMFVGNSSTDATTGGGAISGLAGSTTNIINCTLEENHATGNGGAVWVQGANTLSISGSSITGNWTTGALSNGGGVYIDATTNTSIGQTDITYNTSSGQGGGLYVFDTNLTMTGGSLAHNTSAQNGGGFYIETSSTFMNPVNYTVTLNQVSVTGNTATNGLGGGGFLNHGTLAGQLNAGQLTGNTAGGTGPNGSLPGIGMSLNAFQTITVAAGQQIVEQNAIINRGPQ